MAGLLSGLAGLGLDNLENMNIFEEEEKQEESSAKVVVVEEKDFIYDKKKLPTHSRRAFILDFVY